MSQISEQQVKFYKGGNYTLLSDLLDRREVMTSSFSPTRLVTVSGSNFALINSTIVSGNLAIGNTSITNNGGIQVAALAGTVGTGSVNSVGDSNGILINIVDIRHSVTNDPVLDSNGKTVYGLLQCSNTATDGNAIAASGNENFQISFVIYNDSDVITLTNVTGTIEFQINRLYSTRNLPPLMKLNTLPSPETLVSTKISVRKFTVSAKFAAGEIINLTTGTGNIAGTCSVIGDSVTMPATSNELYNSTKINILRNGVDQTLSSVGEFLYNNTTTIITANALEVCEEITILVYN